MEGTEGNILKGMLQQRGPYIRAKCSGNFIYFFKPLKNHGHFVKDALNFAPPVILDVKDKHRQTVRCATCSLVLSAV